MVSAEGSDLQSVELKVIFRAGGAGKVQYPVDRTVHKPGFGNILLDELEPRVKEEVRDVFFPPCFETVYANHFMAFGQRPIA